MALQIWTGTSNNSKLSLILDGVLDATTAPELEQHLSDHLKEDVITLVLDLQKLTFISSAGLRILAKARKTMQARQGQLCYVHLSPQVAKVFEVVKAVPRSDVFSSLEELDEYLTMIQNRVEHPTD
jgi:anti-anti-sigma factor